jgi:hypothetical protein
MKPTAFGWSFWLAGALTAFGFSYWVWSPAGSGVEPWALVVGGTGAVLTVLSLLRTPGDGAEDSGFEAEMEQRKTYSSATRLERHREWRRERCRHQAGGGGRAQGEAPSTDIRADRPPDPSA